MLNWDTKSAIITMPIIKWGLLKDYIERYIRSYTSYILVEKVVSSLGLLSMFCLVAKLCPTFLWPPCTVANQAPLSMGFPRQEYWNRLPFPLRDLPDPGIETAAPELVKATQLCLTLFDTIEYSLPGSSVQGILQVRILEWVAVPFSRSSSQPSDQTQVSCIGRGILYHWVTREVLC